MYGYMYTISRVGENMSHYTGYSSKFNGEHKSVEPHGLN